MRIPESQNPSMLEVARNYLARDWQPVPVPYREKAPVIKGWQNLRLGEDDLGLHFNGALQNVGILLGDPSGGLVDTDLDMPEALMLAPQFLPGTSAIFGRAGKPRSHALYIVKPAPRTTKYKAPDGAMIVELRSTGCQTVFPTSTHPSGETIVWYEDGDPAEIDGDLLDARLRLLATASLFARCWPSEGSRQNAAMALAGALLRSERIPQDEIADFVENVAAAAGDDESEMRRRAAEATIAKARDDGEVTGWPTLATLLNDGDSVVKLARKWLRVATTASTLTVHTTDDSEVTIGGTVKDENYTELGIADRMLVANGNDVRYAHGIGWLYWTGSHWKRDTDGKVEEFAKQTIRRTFIEIGNLAADERVWATKGLTRLERSGAIQGILALASSDPRARISVDDLDTHDDLLVCTNGTVNLRTGELCPSDRADLMTRSTNVAYRPDAKAERFQRFLREVFERNEELIQFMQKTMGYAATGSTAEQCLFFLHGDGSNGKSVFLGACENALGDYACTASPDTFMVKRSEGIPNDIARLAGVRCVTSIETEEGKRLAEALVKQMTGGDKLVARFMRREFFQFKPRFKIMLAANHKPRIVGTDWAIWRRVRLVPFTVTIPEKEKDTRLSETLAGEAEGVLAWVIEGARRWYAEGLTLPTEVVAATDEYRAESDTVAGFIESCCRTGDGLKANGGDLLHAYEEWCRDTGERPLPGKSFARNMTAKGFQPDRGAKNKVIRLGIALIETQPTA